MMEDHKGGAASFFPLPSPVLRLAFTLHQMSTCSKMVSGMRRGKHDRAVRSQEGTLGLHSFVQETVQRMNTEMIQ